MERGYRGLEGIFKSKRGFTPCREGGVAHVTLPLTVERLATTAASHSSEQLQCRALPERERR